MTSGADRQAFQRAESAGRQGERLARLEERMDEARTHIKSLQTDMDGLKRFQAWLFGIGTAIGAIAVFLANGIKDWLKT